MLIGKRLDSRPMLLSTGPSRRRRPELQPQSGSEPPGDCPRGSFYSRLSSATMAWKHRTAIADAINGKNSTSIDLSI
jgi:hypothetical protein